MKEFILQTPYAEVTVKVKTEDEYWLDDIEEYLYEKTTGVSLKGSREWMQAVDLKRAELNSIK